MNIDWNCLFAHVPDAAARLERKVTVTTNQTVQKTFL